MQGHHLIFDADDTLWMSNRMFEEATDAFIAWLDHPRLDAAAVRDVLDDVARVTYAVHGTSTRNYGRGLELTYRLLAPAATPEGLAHVERLAGRVSWDEPRIIDGVRETLTALGERHDLMILTRGDDAEQRRKIEASGLAGHFRATVVVPDKDVAAYRAVVAEHALDAERTWMIGNSPRYDIVPALEAGLGAVHIPSETTWVLEDAPVPEPADGRLLRLQRFRDLLSHF